MTPPQLLEGIGAAPGMAEGPLVQYTQPALNVPRYLAQSPEIETQRLEAARQHTSAALFALQSDLESRGRPDEGAVFKAHEMFLNDRALLNTVNKKLDENLNAEAAWIDAIEFHAVQLEALPSPLLAARAADIRDVGRQVLVRLLGRDVDAFALDQPVVIAALDLSPSQTAQLDPRFVRALCTAQGGPTSHSAILAKALGIPAVVAVGPDLLDLPNGTQVLVDGTTGHIHANPTDTQREQFAQRAKRYATLVQQAEARSGEQAVTLDGKRIEVAANIGNVEDAVMALQHGADGSGLFRTEFLYLDRQSMPTEAEQVAIYREVFSVLEGYPVVVRMLDIGGDKPVPYLGVQHEDNPFLGWRGIRILTGRPDVIHSQLRAVLQAAGKTDLRIMFPMVSGLSEVKAARELFNRTRQELTAEGLTVPASIQFGIMVEVPSAALLADHLCEQVDFFSIGTNDLTQYTLAVDRTNSRVAPLATPFHPAVLRLIDNTIRAAHQHGRWVGLCGEMAGDPLAVPLLLGLGLDEFSMAPPLVPHIKQAIRTWSLPDAEEVARQAVNLPTAAAVLEFLQSVRKNTESGEK